MQQSSRSFKTSVLEHCQLIHAATLHMCQNAKRQARWQVCALVPAWLSRVSQTFTVLACCDFLFVDIRGMMRKQMCKDVPTIGFQKDPAVPAKQPRSDLFCCPFLLVASAPLQFSPSARACFIESLIGFGPSGRSGFLLGSFEQRCSDCCEGWLARLYSYGVLPCRVAANFEQQQESPARLGSAPAPEYTSTLATLRPTAVWSF
jgi:hypothetical protein